MAAHLLASRRRTDRRKSWGLIDAVEHRLMRPWMRKQPPEVEELLVGLTRAGEHSVLWLVLAAAGALFGGRRARGAAEQGVLALACTSATANGLKLVSRRRRPGRRRLLHHNPSSSSFPSGHSASAFAFAVAASRELPEAGPVLLPLAAGVAYSRVYLGVHYPSGVIAGAAIGTAFGLAARPVARRLGISGEASDSKSAGAHDATLREQAASVRTGVREAQYATASKLAAHADVTQDRLLRLGTRIKDAEHALTAESAGDPTTSTDA